jgi:hypothetical protein
MENIKYNDMQFTVAQQGAGWTITRLLPNGAGALCGSGLFAGLPEAEVATRALALIKTVFPVGIKTVGPDVTHPNRIGDLKIVGPDVTHPNFIYWDKDSVSNPK